MKTRAGRRRENIDREREIEQKIKPKKRIRRKSSPCSSSSLAPMDSPKDVTGAKTLVSLSGGEPTPPSSQGKLGKSGKSGKYGRSGKLVEEWSDEETESLIRMLRHQKSVGRGHCRDIAKQLNVEFGVDVFTSDNVRTKVRSLGNIFAQYVDSAGSSSQSLQSKFERNVSLLKDNKESLTVVFSGNKTSALQEEEPAVWKEPEVWSKDHALSYLTTHKLHHTKLPLYAAALSHELASATLDCLPFVPGFKANSGRASVSVDGRGGEVVVVSSSWSTGVAGSLSTGVLGSRGAGESRERWCDGVC